MPRMEQSKHGQDSNKPHLNFFNYPIKIREELEESIRRKLYGTHEPLTEEEQLFYDTEHEFLASDDQPNYKHRNNINKKL